MGKCRLALVDLTLAELQEAGARGLPGLLGIEIPEAGDGRARAWLALGEQHQAPNGYLHAGTLVALADSACGYGCIRTLPEGATGFTTIELKANFLRSVQDGTLDCEAQLVHGGRTTQIWDATIAGPDGRTMALFRCTQLLLR